MLASAGRMQDLSICGVLRAVSACALVVLFAAVSADCCCAFPTRLQVDNSGALDEEDFAVLLGKTYGEAAVKKVMEADTNHDGKIDLAEFKAAMLSLQGTGMGRIRE